MKHEPSRFSTPRSLSARATRWLQLLLPVFLLLPTLSHAAPGVLASSPLFLSGTVKPNIIFTLDNSGSMSWSFMPESVFYYIYRPQAESSTFNKMYYDPSATYVAPPDASGSSLGDAPFTGAWLDGINKGATVDLSTSFRPTWYYSWSSYAYVGTPQPAYYNVYDPTGTGCISPSVTNDLCYRKVVVSATSGPGGTDERQNFANWYSYYRTRILAMKSGLGRAFNVLNDQYRVGFSTINTNLGWPNTIGDNFIPIDDFNAAQRTLWYNQLYSISPNGGTPLRDSLKYDGEYFKTGRMFGTSSSDPVQASCQQNFAILSTDGYWNGVSPSLGNQDRTVPTLPQPVTGLTAGAQWPAPFYEGPVPTFNTLADVSMYYWVNDLRGSMTDNVPTSPADPASWQHMTTFTIGLGAGGTLNYPGDWSALQAGTKNWPVPVSNTSTTVDDLWHAAVNGHGEFLRASDPSSLATGLSSILGSIVSRSGSAAAVTFNTSTLGTSSAVYTALFNSGSWSGDLISYPLDPVTGDVGATPNWQAAAVLDARDITGSPRVMLTYSSTAVDGAPFQWSNLTTAQQNDLRTNSAGGTDPVAEGQARLAFLRGDRSNEGTGYNFRKRASRLGDIVHSAPVFLGQPSVTWPDTAPFPTTTGQRYSDFRAAQAGRLGVVYVGTNDGMLHAFREDTGAEVLSYVPSNLFSTSTGAGLHTLTESTYSHRYYVDLTPTVAPAYIKTTTTGVAAWRSILVGAERGGGRGLFALDVTDPTAFTESNAANLVLWEFNDSNDSDMGYSFSQPTVVLMNNGRWAAVFGNGYNDAGSGHAQLFIVFLDGGLDGTWTLGTDYIKIDTGVGSTASRNGLSTPAVVDVNGDGVADRIFAGDLEGNMWAFDVSNSNPVQWKVAYKSGSTPKPLFTTPSGQPITVKPEVAFNPQVTSSPSNSPNMLVFFGTGQYLTNADKATTTTQTMYGVWDQGKGELTRSDLQQQTFEPGFPANVRVPTDYPVNYTGSGSSKQYGWYLDLTDTGERLVTDPVLRGLYLYFNTSVPSSSACSYGGSSWSMALKYENGGRPAAPAFDFINDGRLDASDLVSSSSLSSVAPGGVKKGTLLSAPRFLSDYKYESDTGSTKPTKTRVPKLFGVNNGRLSWRELGR